MAIYKLIDNDNSNCIYWDSIIIDSIPDFSHYNIYTSDDITFHLTIPKYYLRNNDINNDIDDDNILVLTNSKP